MWLQLAEGRRNETDWTFRIGVKDAAKEQESVRSLGVMTTEMETVSGVISFFGFTDPDGNRLSFYQLHR